MCAGNHAREHSVELTLRAGTNNTNTFVRKFNNIFHFHNSIFWNLNGMGAKGDFNVVNHRKTREGDFAATGMGFFQNKLDTTNL